jgi:hypothetical protein
MSDLKTTRCPCGGRSLDECIQRDDCDGPYRKTETTPCGLEIAP